MRPFNGIKPQDIVILLKLIVMGNGHWRHVDIAKDLSLSQTEISFALDRCKTAGFIDSTKKKILKSALLEFLVHGLKYAFPAKPGPVCRGVPTAHSAPPLSKTITASDGEYYVWPWDDGKVRGQSIEPMYPNAPLAAKNDPKLYELLALIDAVRAGRARERVIAVREREARIAKSAEDK